MGDGPVCTVCVTDMSASGARLRIGDQVLPDEFVVVIPSLGRAVRVAKRWSADLQMGVAFLEETPALATVAPARHLRERETRLWREALYARP